MVHTEGREMNGAINNGGLPAIGLVSLCVETFLPYLSPPQRNALKDIATQGIVGFKIAEVVSHASNGDLAMMARTVNRLARHESPGTALKDALGIDRAQRVRTTCNND